MASSRIKGITIELGADATELTKALEKIDGNLDETNAKLRDVNKLLKLDPKNVELLNQKQEALNAAIKDTKSRLETLKTAINQQTDPTKVEALKREYIATEQQLKALTSQVEAFGKTASARFKEVGEKLSKMGDKMQSVGKSLTTTLTLPIVGAATAGIAYNSTLEKQHILFETLLGSYEEADSVIKAIQEDASKSPFDTQTLVQVNQLLISAGTSADESRKVINDLGNAVAATGGGSAELERMAANLQQIKNVGKASAQDIKQFANAGINIYGLLAEATGKSVEEVKEMDVSYELLTESLAKASAEGGKYYGAMEKLSGTMDGQLSSLKDEVGQLLGELTADLLPIIKDIITGIKDAVKSVKNASPTTKKIIKIVAAILAALGPVLVIVGKVISLIGVISTAAGALNVAMLPMIGTIAGIVAGVAAVIAIGVLLYKNWDKIKEKAIELWNSLQQTWENIKTTIANKAESIKATVSEKFNNIKTAASNIWDSIKTTAASKWDALKTTITDKVESLKEKVRGLWEGIKSFFTEGISIPHIKLPHFSVQGSLNPLNWFEQGLPKIGIEWYAKAMDQPYTFNHPTVIGVGEAGSETVIGTKKLNELLTKVGNTNNSIVVNVNANVASNVDINRLANTISSKIQQQVNMKVAAAR